MEENSNIFFASDHHFGHDFLRKIRNFETTEEHDQQIIEAHNRVVKKGDDVYLLGDFMFRSRKHLQFYTDQMNGNLHLLRGNHDGIGLETKHKGFSWVKDYYEMKIPNLLSESWKSDPQIRFVLSHYPMLAWHHNSKGAIMLHGHTHLSLRDSANYTEASRGKTMDVCICPENNWEPWSLRDVLKIMETREIVAPDCENY